MAKFSLALSDGLRDLSALFDDYTHEPRMLDPADARAINRTYMTFDGLMKVTVQVAEFMDFGSELQTAKGLVDECLNEWSADSRPEIQTIVTQAFNTDQEGKVNRTEILKLLRLDIKDERWAKAMDAIRDAQRPRSSKEYIRFGIKEDQKAPWVTITLDLASV